MKAAVYGGEAFLRYQSLVEEGENSDSPERMKARDDFIKQSLDIAGTSLGLNLKTLFEGGKTIEAYDTGETF
jgi:hypothetical protein